MRIGVISDTQGLLRPEALAALAGVEQVIHAGDIGGLQVLTGLGQLAPVTAVAGNIDLGQEWSASLAEQQRLELAGWQILLVHDRAQVDQPADVDLVIYGHSHRPQWQRHETVHWLNPGSAGRRRFTLPVSLAILELNGATINVNFVDLLA